LRFCANRRRSGCGRFVRSGESQQTGESFPKNLFEKSNPRFRSGQTRERIPSNAWARKIAAPTKPITAVIVSNIANVPLRYCATENGGRLAQSKRFPGTNTQSRSIEDSAQQTRIVL
jgi:hypothetical protein